MILSEPASFIKSFIVDLNVALKELKPSAGLTRTQITWLGFCLMGILLIHSVCWAKFERASLGKYKLASLSWMFRHSKRAWTLLFLASVQHILVQHGITEGMLVLDETDRARSKKTKRIHKTHKQKDKKTGGYVNGQTIVLLLLVTHSVSIPVGFSFYMPDPVLSAWKKEDKRLKKQGVLKKDRPVEPTRSPDYPTKQQVALGLLQEFKKHHGEINIQAILADYFSENNVIYCEINNITPYIANGRQYHNLPLDHYLTESKDSFKEEKLQEIDKESVIDQMKNRMKTEEGREFYAKRKSTIEPVFGIIKEVMGFRQFLLRGFEAVKGEWNLVCIAFNLKRIHTLI